VCCLCATTSAADAEAVRPLKMYATKWHIAFGLMLVLGLLTQKVISVI
jgi:hypothetical protein